MRFCVITNSGIRYYDKKPTNINDSTNLRGIILFSGLILSNEPFASEESKSLRKSTRAIKRLSMSVNSGLSFNSYSIFLKTPFGHTFELTTSSEKEKEEWFQQIQEKIQEKNQEKM